MNMASLPSYTITPNCGAGTLEKVLEGLGGPIMGQVLGAATFIGYCLIVLDVALVIILSFTNRRGKAMVAALIVLGCLVILEAIPKIINAVAPGGC